MKDDMMIKDEKINKTVMEECERAAVKKEEAGKVMLNREEWKKQLGVIVQLGSAYVLEWMWRTEWR